MSGVGAAVIVVALGVLVGLCLELSGYTSPTGFWLLGAVTAFIADAIWDALNEAE